MPHTVETLGEDALLLRFGDTIDAATNDIVHAFARRIAQARPHWLRDLVPAYASLALFVDGDAFACDADPLAEARRWLQQLPPLQDDHNARGRLIEIPVRYGGQYGPDLPALAAYAALDADEVVARHCAVEYRVAMLGFAPGFPYLLGLEPALAMPRLATPRLHVAAGSVGIGGTQTGIYPREGPGGWRIIGRTARPLFEATREPPALLAPGDRVRFVAEQAP